MAQAATSPARGSVWSGKLKDVGVWAEWAALVGLVVLVVVFQALNSTFLSLGNVQAMLVSAAILVVLSVGQTFVVATGGIDLSIASTMTFGAVAFGGAFAAGLPMVVCCLLAVVAGGAIGLVNGLLIGRGKITD